jgi:peptidoglycan/xylan/chitin deacetylase (PgdA/CDA1 family)
MNYRSGLRTACNTSGFTRFRWSRLPLGLYVFTYHRVGDSAACRFDRGVYSCTEATLRRHLSLFRERFEVLNLEGLLSLISRNHPLQTGGRPLALLTFDDGYVDSYAVVLPMLQEFGLTAVFFVPTAFVGSSRLPWWDQIASAMRNASVDRLRLRGCDETFCLCADVLEHSIMRVLFYVRQPAGVRVAERVAEIQDSCRPIDSIEEQEPLFVSWKQIREMHAAGMDIGSHTHTHPVLSHLDRNAQLHELTYSKAALESELQSPIWAVAYPAAKHSAYTAETIEVARLAKYRLGFNFKNCRNASRVADPLDINRLDVDGNIDCAALKTHICFPWL